MASDKDIIYIDIDDEITGIIDKLKASSAKEVTLVLPKRAAVFQSSVNMKLLKRAADADKKKAILVTSEAGLLPLAGATGIFVAKTLTAMPVIPPPPNLEGTAEDSVSEAGEALSEPKVDPKQTVGQLSGLPPSPAAGIPVKADSDVETIALDDEEVSPEGALVTEPRSFDVPSKAKPKKNKKLKIPNFERFRLIIVLIILLLLVAGSIFIFTNTSLAKATIDIKTNASDINVSQDLTLSTSAESLSLDGSSVPAKYVQMQKTYTQTVPTTGQQNEGQQATGSVTITAQECAPNLGQPPSLPAGSGISANNITYITQQNTTFSIFGSAVNGSCQDYNSTSSTPITAQNAGSSSNTPAGTSFSVAGRQDLSASGSASGGTDDIVQTVNQNDINNAKSKISTNNGSAESALESQIKGAGGYPLSATFNAGTPSVTSSTPVGQAANTVTVTETINYTMFSAQQSDLQTLLDNNIDAQIDTTKQTIMDDGLSSATYNLTSMTASTASLTLTTKGVVGPDLSKQSIDQDVEGQKAGAIQSSLTSIPGVTSVTVKFSPFWIDSAPKNTSKITIVIAKPSS